MKVKNVALALMLCASLAACGGSGSGGGGGSLPASTVEVLYQLTNDGSPTQQAFGALLQFLGENCPAVAGNVVVDSGDVACDLGGTWRLTGTVNCMLVETPPTLTLTITSMTGAKLALTSCASLVTTVDTNGDGVSDTTSTILTGNVDPFALSDTVVNATFPSGPGTDPTSVVINGQATNTYASMALTGDRTATVSFTNVFTFTNFDFVTDANPPTCAANIVSATEGSDSGQCTIQTDCRECI